MTIHNRVNGLCYTVKLPCPELYSLSEKYQKALSEFLKSKMAGENLHLGLKYLGYEKDYEDEYFESLSIEIDKIVKRHLPIKIKILGLGGFWNSPEWSSEPIIFLKVELNDELKKLHKDLVDSLNGKADTFLLAEQDKYTPHITIGVGKEIFGKELKKFVSKSGLESPIQIILEKAQMRMKGGRVLKLN